MQREKLYNSYRMANLIVTCVGLKISILLSDQIWTLWKQCDFSKRQIQFFLISSLLYVMFSIKQKAIRTTRCSVKSSTICTIQLLLQLRFLFWKSTKFWTIKFRLCKKIVFLACDERVFYLIYPLVCFILKKQNTPQDAAWKTLQFTKNSLCSQGPFCF
jgi:hypothetical protein